MTKNDISLDELNTTIQRINEAIKKSPEIKSELLSLRKKLEIMKVSIIELMSSRDDFERGNITTESYQVQSKKLRMDIERARNDADLLGMIDKVADEEEKPKLLRLKDAIVSNKDFIITVAEILKSIILSSKL